MVCNKQCITLGHCEIWSHFARTFYFHSPSAHDNTVATRHIPVYVISLIYCTTSLAQLVRIRVLTRNACLHLVYASVLYWRTCPRKYGPVFKSIKSLDGDLVMDGCHYAVPFKDISIRSTPEIVILSKRNQQLQESEDKRWLSWMTNYYREWTSPLFNGNHFLVVCHLA